LQITVQDNGPGIPPAIAGRNLQKVFTRPIQKFAQGLGLGLAFCQLAVKAHNGQIWVESELNQGSSFIFTLPVVE
jgi:signal transduction histidine kinase